jgi:hypothetical protein
MTISRNARKILYQRLALTENAVEKGRLADIRATHNSDQGHT